jgi:DNA-directed RNA polymerase subunit RPC12/RpoP
MKDFIKKFIFYLFRWQLSTPILGVVLIWLATMNKWVAAAIANLIGGALFFWVDKWIFKETFLAPLWEIKENIKCVDCGKICQGFRLVKTGNYNRLKDKKPEFRCEKCSKKKLDQLRQQGVKI